MVDPSPTTINRERLTTDLSLVSVRLAELLTPHLVALFAPLPRLIRGPLEAAILTGGRTLPARIGEALSPLLTLTDDELATLVDALATELGVLRNVRAPALMTHELAEALERLEVAMGAGPSGAPGA